MSTQPENRLGLVVSGSLNQGINVRLDPACSVEDITVGHLVTIQGRARRFFGMINDIRLEVSDPAILQSPVKAEDPEVAPMIHRCVKEKKTFTATFTYNALKLIAFRRVNQIVSQ